MTTIIKTLSLILILNVTYAHGMEETKDARLLLELPKEILGTVIKCAAKSDEFENNIFEATKLLIRTSWLCKNFKSLSEPNNIQTTLCLDQKKLNDTLRLYALYSKSETRPMPDLTPFFKLLIAMGADTNYFTDLSTCICTTKNTYLIEHYITHHKPDINIQDHHKETPLYLAVSLGYENVADLLLTHGADMYLADRHGMTPTDHALLHDNVECLKVLIKHGVDTTIEYPRGKDFKLTIAEWAKSRTWYKKENTDAYHEIYKLVTGEEISKSWDEKSVSELLHDTCVIS
jgi:hypothetical protein